jgi:hypothetical protein
MSAAEAEPQVTAAAQGKAETRVAAGGLQT